MSRRLVLVLALVLFAPLAEAQGLVRAVGPIGMTVSDMERSIAFYSRITTLRAATGPGVEFLEYLTPRNGRPAPADARPNDVVHWQTSLVLADAGAAFRATRGNACGTLSSDVVAPAERALGFALGVLLRDPDGHALRVVQP